MEYIFKQAKPVWGTDLKNRYNQFLGFYAEIKEHRKIRIAIAARSSYRLFVNGKLYACGPARCADHYCRVDVLNIEGSQTEGGAEKSSVAVEIAAFDKMGKYCNDNTLEKGIFIAEIEDENGNVLAATGKNGEFLYQELAYRRSNVETMSHSRGILEWYDLKPDSYAWIRGKGNWQTPQEVSEKITFLERRAPYATLNSIRISHFMGIYDMIDTKNAGEGFVLQLARTFNREWYEQLPEENQFLQKLRGLEERAFSGSFRLKQDLQIKPETGIVSAVFEHPVSELGFVEFDVKVEKETILDLINTDHLSYEGELKANTYVTRYNLKPGSYHLITFEPKLVRYLRFLFHTEGEIRLGWPSVLDDSYPDPGICSFFTNDGDLNRIYEGAKRTLRLSTLDIFMDCPQRERGGWLCDSTFSAEAAWQLFGSLGTEKDFLENFLLTENMWKGFFPEVYPGSKKDKTDPGIINWSYWLAIELCDYYQRSGDRAFLEKFRCRIEEFVNGMLSLRGKTGLIETEKGEFVDWSLANRDFALKPISIANNCLAVKVLERLGEIYGQPSWKKAAQDMRAIIERLDDTAGIFGGGGDGAIVEDGKLKRNDCPSEGGRSLEIYSGFHRNDRIYLRQFIKTMGPCPEFPANPNIAGSNLFIGLMIRFAVLSELGETEELIRELKQVYLEELKVGSGTFFENINAISGCHGFNGMAGALLKKNILGLDQPSELEKKILFAPHPCGLRWAEGTSLCSDGMIFCKWQADYEEHELRIILQLPQEWKAEFVRPFELSGWKVLLNGHMAEI